MSKVYYTEDHEWIRVEDGKEGTVGITDFAQAQMGDVVFVELPPVGTVLTQGEQAAVVESVKAASELYAPVSGTVVAVNPDLPDAPGTVNEDPQGEGWFFRLALTQPNELADLMDQDAYEVFVAEAGESAG
ncbi:glycine cleavage system protein GcvH [Pararhodospirillum oryzae]|uniref:Glycine cleavage system H protein n=1 Tax=Pararhodospirillum oryzae TaxID=478448 RepID=A0A512H6F1_9PROT|nr:glycine cleavage system protein GcvH [Pararhodospirillum oryzae]GEO81014.1 glycine cleavage system H protein [Pararhodospirillum oryzae]